MRSLIERCDPTFSLYLRVTGSALNAIAAAMFVVMLGTNAYNIFLRTILGQGIMWHQEISIMAAFWIYFAAYSLLSKEDGFIRVEFLVDRFSRAAQRVASILIALAIIAFHVILLRLCLVTLEVVSIYETPILEWPEYIYYIPLTVGTADIVVTECILLLRALAFPDRPRPRSSVAAAG